VQGKKLMAVKEGKKLWECEVDGALTSSPRRGTDGIVYAGSSNGRVYAIRDGKKLWEFKLGGAVNSTPCCGDDGMVYVGSNDGKLYGLLAPLEAMAGGEESLADMYEDDQWLIIDDIKMKKHRKQ
jgi:outer membrane protein assembly factor BamB